MLDLMIDIETEGEIPSSRILTIGAVFFDRHSMRTGNRFYAKASPSKGLNADRAVTKGTTWFWNQKGMEQAKAEAFSGTADLADVLVQFKEWVRSNASLNKVRPWGNGSTFDEVLIENACAQIQLPPPWKFYNIRDVRTLLDATGIDKNKVEFVGIQHIADDDALHEAVLVQQGFRKLRDAGVVYER